MFAEVIIPLALPRNYTWSVPERFRDQVRPGVRVEVVLGKNKKYAGVIRAIHDIMPQAFEPKEILNVLDVEPIIFDHQLSLWNWIAQYYMCSEGEVMAAALPSHFKLSSETTIVFSEEYGEDFSALDHDEYLVAEALLIRKELKVPEVQQILDSSHVYPVIKRLIEKKVCMVWEALKETYSPKKETFVQLNVAYDDEEALAQLLNEDKKLQRAEKQMELLLSYLHLQKTVGEVTKSELLKKSGASDSQLKGLVDKNILWLEKRNIDRLLYLPQNITIDFTLTAAQQEAYEKVVESFDQKAVTLLHGVTASGKTQVYVKLIEKVIRQGQQVLYLLPEIALTSQIIRRLQKHFGGYIGIYHSKFNQNERIEIWNKVKNGELKVVLGARSSLFLPFSDLGLVVVDEEHDPSYKQHEPAPRYNARDAAIYYASLFKARVLLGSATPSVESYYNAQQQKYGFVELSERFGGVKMPTIELIDIKKTPKTNKEKVILTPDLKTAIQRSLEAGKQVILFQNRRGYSPYQVCQTCGWIPQCKFCDVSLNFHKNTNKLHCHYCGTVYPLVYTCQACGNHHFLQQNFGTERIEEHLEEQLPGVKVARMDIDSVRGKTAHDNLIQQFEQQRIQVLVGTQMVVKGLDFENVNLVGVLDADSLLSFADFRVNERAFQLMEQVSGRAGRKDGEGHVMIQVSQMAHPVLHYVQQHNYPAFFKTEIEARRQFMYPPFSRIILLTFRNKSKDLVNGAAKQLAEYLKPQFGQYMVGPAEPVVNRVRNQYLMELMFKLPKDTALISRCKQQIQDQIAVLHNDKRFRSVVIIPDVDTQ
ncbi:primosomal protein N' [Pseudoflavitalea sp. G-6-1-2]|uniref:replication restart helicase PriA n=1 Tax=Pseudoflavitalea sp. G-6-1-2 TaxID=2728841 RepID=UPI00146C7DB8|nr:primosomal protein N' [Pseudoflavitalea sp. G-6-1-2]NML21771.1 primosomal protein N' [Pseudoflavitalea sp. G-6-1-2]